MSVRESEPRERKIIQNMCMKAARVFHVNSILAVITSMDIRKKKKELYIYVYIRIYRGCSKTHAISLNCKFFGQLNSRKRNFQ